MQERSYLENSSLFHHIDEDAKSKILKIRDIANKILASKKINKNEERLDRISDQEASWLSYVIKVEADAEIAYMMNDEFSEYVVENELNFKNDKNNIIFRFESGKYK